MQRGDKYLFGMRLYYSCPVMHMKSKGKTMLKYAAILLSLIAILIHCGTNPSSTSAVASESWRLYDAASSQNYSDVTLSKLSNGTISVQGSWYYDFIGSMITCAIMTGSATIVDTSVTINTQGTASYPRDSAGNTDSSPFTMQMAGIFKGGVSSGTWEIHFSDTTWEGWINPGPFNGRLQSGSSVTAP